MSQTRDISRQRIGAIFMFVALALTSLAFSKVPDHQRIYDDQGRQLIPGGFVTLESTPYTADDYQKMVRMGASFQVIRVPVGMIGAWPGTKANERDLAHFDELVQLGKDVGIRTIFKLVNYGVKPRGEPFWQMLWSDTDQAQGRLLEGWTRLWIRYKDEASVFGYDLLNEPTRGLDPNYDKIQRKKLLPLLRRMTDAMHDISPEKWALYQPLLRKPEDQPGPGRDPIVPIEEPFGRERVIYAPHLYQMDPDVIAPMLDDLERQALISKAPLLLGEWGSPTYSNTDNNPKEQQRYTKIYKRTVNELDRRSVGGIKAWFCGGTRKIPAGDDWMTWAIFSDPSSTGKVEREYITHVIARPRPLVVAGTVESYQNDFDVNSFEMSLKTAPPLGATEVFIPAERYYKEGFKVDIGPDLSLRCPPNAAKLETLSAKSADNHEQAKWLRWDESKQRLSIEKWIGDSRTLTIRVSPYPQK